MKFNTSPIALALLAGLLLGGCGSDGTNASVTCSHEFGAVETSYASCGRVN